jgi:FlaA1/EpsC-like NDP-sugar epimerase
LEKEEDPPIVTIGFIDDDPQKKGKRLGGIKVLGDRNHLGLLRQLHDVHTVFVAIPSASLSELRNVLDLCRGLGFDTEIFLARNDIFAKLYSKEQPVMNAGYKISQNIS